MTLLVIYYISMHRLLNTVKDKEEHLPLLLTFDKKYFSVQDSSMEIKIVSRRLVLKTSKYLDIDIHS